MSDEGYQGVRCEVENSVGDTLEDRIRDRSEIGDNSETNGRQSVTLPEMDERQIGDRSGTDRRDGSETDRRDRSETTRRQTETISDAIGDR